MNTIIKLFLKSTAHLNVLIPEFPDKDNYYYKPSEKLHIFDLVTLVYCNHDKKIVLLEDSAQEIIGVSEWAPTRALEGERILPDHIPLGHASLFFSLDIQHENSNFNDRDFWLWSSPSKIQTWLYTREDKIYVEVSSTYPWLFSDPEPSDKYYSFDEYVANYKPIAVHEMSTETAEQWIKQSAALLKSMDRPPQRK